MKYGTPTRVRYTIPFVKRTLDSNIKDPKVKMRLKWMLYIDSGNTIAKTSRHFDIPIRTIKYWRKRYNPFKIKYSLRDKSKRPINCRTSSVPLSTITLVKGIRRKHLYLGKEKIQHILKRDFNIAIGRTRIQKIINSDHSLKYYGTIKRYKRKNKVKKKHMYSVPKHILDVPGGLVYLDVKHLSIVGGQKVYQFTAIDHCTRMLFLKVYSNITSKSGADFVMHIQKILEDTKIQYIGSDNGSEFEGYVTNLLSELKIDHVFSSPRSPKQNPFVERVIRTTIDELHLLYGTVYSIKNQQYLIDRYLYEYNFYRPHHSLKKDTPFEYYVKMSKAITMK